MTLLLFRMITHKLINCLLLFYYFVGRRKLMICASRERNVILLAPIERSPLSSASLGVKHLPLVAMTHFVSLMH